MDKKPDDADTKSESDFSRQVARQQARKLRATKRTVHGIWFGLGMMGLVGWSAAIPTMIGTALGLWLDRRYPSQHSWTLALLVAGLCIGCANAWHWVVKETAAIHKDLEDEPEDKKDE